MLERIRRRTRSAWLLHALLILSLLSLPAGRIAHADGADGFVFTGSHSRVEVSVWAPGGTAGVATGQTRQVIARAETITSELWRNPATMEVQLRNPVTTPNAGIGITFSIWGEGDYGSVMPETATTDASGLCVTTFTMGQEAAVLTATLDEGGASGSLTFGDPLVPETWTHDHDESMVTASLRAPGGADGLGEGDTRLLEVYAEAVEWEVQVSSAGRTRNANCRTSPAIGAEVTWWVTGGDGTLDAQSAYTDIFGRASVTFTMGYEASIVQADLRYFTGSSTAATFGFSPPEEEWTVTGEEVIVTGITLSTDGATDALPPDTVCSVTANVSAYLHRNLVGSFGNFRTEDIEGGAEGLEVAFSITQGGGEPSNLTATTDANGNATVSFTTGEEGSRVTATIDGFSAQLDFYAGVEEWYPVGSRSELSVSLFPSDSPTNDLTRDVPRTLAVQAATTTWDSFISNFLRTKDENETFSAWPGATLRFTVIAGDGTVSPATAVTDGDGLASTEFTLGRTMTSTVQVDIMQGGASIFHSTIELSAAETPWTFLREERILATTVSTHPATDPATAALEPGAERTVAARVMLTTWQIWQDEQGHQEMRNVATNAAAGAPVTFSIGPGEAVGWLSNAGNSTDVDGWVRADFTMGSGPATIRAEANFMSATSSGTLDLGTEPWGFVESQSALGVEVDADATHVTATVTYQTWDVYTDGYGAFEERNIAVSPAWNAAVMFTAEGGASVPSLDDLPFTDVTGKVSIPYTGGATSLGSLTANVNFMTVTQSATILLAESLDSDGDGVSDAEEVRQGSDPNSNESLPPAPVSAPIFHITVPAGLSITKEIPASGGSASPLKIQITGTSALGTFTAIHGQNATFRANSGVAEGSTHTYTYTASDGRKWLGDFIPESMATGTIVVRIGPPLIAKPQEHWDIATDGPFKIELVAEGGDESSYRFSIARHPERGVATVDDEATPKAEYQHGEIFQGEDSFTFTVTDDTGATSTAEIKFSKRIDEDPYTPQFFLAGSTPSKAADPTTYVPGKYIPLPPNEDNDDGDPAPPNPADPLPKDNDDEQIKPADNDIVRVWMTFSRGQDETMAKTGTASVTLPAGFNIYTSPTGGNPLAAGNYPLVVPTDTNPNPNAGRRLAGIMSGGMFLYVETAPGTLVSGEITITSHLVLDNEDTAEPSAKLTLLPFELSSDLNDDGRIDGADSGLKTAGIEDSASDQAKEDGTEYLVANNKLSNGLPDPEDPKLTDHSKKDEDDLQELKTICNATFGAIWFEYEGGDITKLAFYKTKECKPADKVTFNPPFALSETNKLPEKLFVRAEPESGWTAQVEGKLVMKFGKADKRVTWATDKLRFTVVKKLGDTKYFHAARDYIMENNALFFTDEKDYGGELIRVTVMRQEAAKMQAFETYYRNPKLYGIAGVTGANSGQTLIVNGNFVFPFNILDAPPRMTKRCNGRLITGGALHTQVSTDSAQAPTTKGASKDLCSAAAEYIAQLPDGTFTFATGEVPLNAGYAEALGGLSTNYKVREEDAVNMVGQVVINHGGEKKLVFSAQSDPRVSPYGKGGGTIGFETDVGKAQATGKKVYIMDGGSSVAMAFADPNASPTDTLTVQYGGVKHGTIIGYYVNTYLMFKCTRPRNP